MSKETQGLVFKRSNESYSSFDDQIISCLQVCCLHDIIINDFWDVLWNPVWNNEFKRSKFDF